MTKPELSSSPEANNETDCNQLRFFGEAQKASKSQGPATQFGGKADEISIDLDQQQPADQFAWCRLEPTSSAYANLTGRLYFWQPIDNRGALHLVARVRYVIKEQQRKRRESFQAPVKRAPTSPIGDTTNDRLIEGGVGQAKQLHHHEIWLPASGDTCRQLQGDELDNELVTGAGQQQLAAERNLIGELISSQPVDEKRQQEQQVVDIDSETIVTRFNLTGALGNSLVGKCLLLFHLPRARVNKPADQQPARQLIGRCKVELSDKWPAPIGELDHLPSVSVVEPVREDLLVSGRSPGVWEADAWAN